MAGSFQKKKPLQFFTWKTSLNVLIRVMEPEGRETFLNNKTKSLQNTILVIISTLVTYLAFELIFVRVVIQHVPLNMHGGLPEGIRILAQSSKEKVIPEKYIALFGDSYAQGYGDWLLEADPHTNSDFHSAHIIRSLLGADVI